MTHVFILFALACTEKPPGADDSAPVDNTDPARFSGDYPGGLHFSVDITNVPDHDECDGSVLIVVDMAAEVQQLSGEFSCAFTGALAPFSPMLGTFAGSVSDAGEVEGSYDTGGGPVVGTFSTTIDDGGNLGATISGTGTAEGMEIAYTGDFNATRE